MRTKMPAALAVLFLAVLFLDLGLAAPSAAVVVPFRNGRLTIQIEALGTQYRLRAPASGTASGTVNVNRTATTLTSFTLPAGAFSETGVTVDADQLLYPIEGFIGTFANAAGTFSSQGGGDFGGAMGLRLPGASAEPGLVEVCVYLPCDQDVVVPVGLGVVGVEGDPETVDSLITFTIAGAPWTMGTASVPVEGGEEIESGSLMVLGDGYLRTRLVTPIAIEIDNTDFPEIPSQVAAFGLLTLEIAPVPEPGVAATGVAGFGTLSALALQRRRRARREIVAA